MKNWIKKTLITVFGFTLLTGALAGCSREHHSEWSAEDTAHMREKVANKLDLTLPQREKLTVLVDQLVVLKDGVKGESKDPRSELLTLVGGNTFDRSKAQAMLDEKTRAMQADGAPAIIALADFYDSLDPQQQQKVREKLEPHHGWFH